MEWNSVKECKPTHDCLCLVINEKFYRHPVFANYHSDKDEFLVDHHNDYYLPAFMPIAITHWLIVPFCTKD
jgi:hypothetical protein